MSFFARYYMLQWDNEISNRTIGLEIPTDSITHSMPANNAPTLAKPLPLRNMPRPISLNISEAFCVLVICARASGSSYANDEDMSEKKAPIAKPVMLLFLKTRPR